jgi:SAM-dependent methyltransferase
MSREAWTRYWAGGGRGCLPEAAGPIAAAQKKVWQDFARTLPRGARVLDLATGSGAVCRWMAEARRDLKPTGVDSASALPPAPAGIVLKAQVSIASLPFRDGQFGAATSQFGFEYCADPERSAELARVLAPGAPLLMIVHHSESAIVAHNRARRDALRWAIATHLAKAKAFAATGLPIPPSFAQIPGSAPHQAAAEFLTGLVQRLHARAPIAPLEAEALGEIARIDELEAAARDSDGIGALTAELAAAGLAIEPARPLPDPQSDRPLAWLVSGSGTSR